MREASQWIKRSYEVLSEEGPKPLLQKGLFKLRQETECRLAVRRNRFTQSIGQNNVRFTVHGREDYRLSKINAEDEVVITDILSELRSGETFFDVGSAVGAYAIGVAKNCSTVNVVAFEPNPKNRNLLELNVTANDVDLEIMPVALADRDDFIAFEAPRVSGSAHLCREDSDESQESVKALRGDTFTAESGITPDILKIDVEGAEPWVIDGFRETFSESETRAIYCEVHRPNTGNSITEFGITPDVFEEELEDMGFDITVIRDPHPEWNYFIKAIK